MKLYKILSFVFAFGLVLSACEDTNENLVGQRGVAVVPVLTNLVPEAPVFADQKATSFITFTLDLEEGETVDAAEIQVEYLGEVGTIRTIESFPVNVTVTAPEILSALSISESDVELGTSFMVSVMTTSNGVTSRSKAAVEIKMPCEFDPAISEGSYAVECAGWGVDSKVKVTADPSDPYILYISGLAEADSAEGNGNTMKFVIDPVTFGITGETTSTIIADNLAGWGSDYASWLDYSYLIKNGYYTSCDGSFVITFDIGWDGGTDGSYVFNFTRI